MNANTKTGLEMVTVAGLARELGLSPGGLRKILDRHEIAGDAILAEGLSRSELFLRARLPLIKEIINGKEAQ
jgi:lambda repressor-like predicted transcriptional regulator